MLFHVADRASAGPKSCTFQDVAEDDPNAEAIAWAQRHGYISGYGDGRFGPEDSMTMEQAMVMIYRFFGSPAADLSKPNGIKGSEKIAPWARDAVAWAVANGFLGSTHVSSPKVPITVEELTYALSQIVAAA